MARRKGFFKADQAADELARARDVEALLAPRRTVTQHLPLVRIRPNPYQAREQFEGLEELAEAIRQQGFISRLRVRPDPEETGYFQLVYGERRLRAARLAGLTSVPCEIAEHSDAELIEIGLAENIQRQDLTPLEEARAFRLFIDERGYSIRRLAERLGKNKSYVEDRLLLLRVPKDVQDMIEERPDALRAAREIAKLEDAEARAPLIGSVVKGTLNTREVRQAVKAVSASPASNTPVAALDVPRRLRRDRHTVTAILRRWRVMLASMDAAEVAQLTEALETLLDDARSLREELEK